jgi:hypothetical protein
LLIVGRSEKDRQSIVPAAQESVVNRSEWTNDDALTNGKGTSEGMLQMKVRLGAQADPVKIVGIQITTIQAKRK